VDFAAFDVWRPFVEQARQHADQACFRLAPQAEQNKIMARQDGVDHLRHYGIFVPENARKQGIAALDFADQIGAHLVLDGARSKFGLGEGTLAKCA